MIHLDRTDGSLVWFKELLDKDKNTIFHGPTFAGDKLWIAGENKKLLAVDVNTGRIEIDIDLDLIPKGAPLYSNRKLIVYSSDGEFLSFE